MAEHSYHWRLPSSFGTTHRLGENSLDSSFSRETNASQARSTTVTTLSRSPARLRGNPFYAKSKEAHRPSSGTSGPLIWPTSGPLPASKSNAGVEPSHFRARVNISNHSVSCLSSGVDHSSLRRPRYRYPPQGCRPIIPTNDASSTRFSVCRIIQSPQTFTTY